MMTLLAAPLFLLVFTVLTGPISRLIGARFATTILFSTGVFVLPLVAGLTWRAVLLGGGDLVVLFAGAALTRRFSGSSQICATWLRRVAAAFSCGLFVVFAVFALLTAYLSGTGYYALPFDVGVLISAIAAAVLLQRPQEQVFTRSGAGSLVAASPQA
jgi:hypothetical protein